MCDDFFLYMSRKNEHKKKLMVREIGSHKTALLGLWYT